MKNFSEIQSLITILNQDPLKYLEINRPQYYQKYVGQIDKYGYNLKTFARYEPIFQFFFEKYFKVNITGIENIPSSGPVILVGNHSGMLPVDAGMTTMAMCKLHPNPRRIRYLITDWFFQITGVSRWVKEVGQVRASLTNAYKLIDDNEIIGIYPEGIRGVGKPLKQKYRLIDFHPGFIKLAIPKNVPIVPISTLGGDEIFMIFKNVKMLSRLLKMPFYPLTLAFPWLPFPAMFVPLPVKWQIKIHEPIYLNLNPDQVNNTKIIFEKSHEIQYIIQKELNEMYHNRQTFFSFEKLS